MKKQRYIVTLRKSYMEQRFEFDEGRIALAFAGIARENYLDDEPNYKFSVAIDVVEVEIEDKPEPEPEPEQEQEQTSKVDEKIEENAKKDEEV